MRKKIIILLLALIILPIKGNAATGSLNISCTPDKVKAGESTTCKITGNIDQPINTISADIKLSDNLNILTDTFILNSTWNGNDIDDGKINVYPKSGDDVSGNFELGSFEVKVKNGTVNTNEKVELINITFDNDWTNYEVPNTYYTIRVPNNVNTLKSLSIDGLTLSPKFSSDTTSYSASTTTDSIEINASATDSNATINGLGIKTLKNGKNTFEVVVAAEDSSIKTYIITINANISTPSSNNESSEKEIDNNLPTGDVTIIIIAVLAVLALGYTIYYFTKRKNNI